MAESMSLIPGGGAKISHAVRHSQKAKKKKKLSCQIKKDRKKGLGEERLESWYWRGKSLRFVDAKVL